MFVITSCICLSVRLSLQQGGARVITYDHTLGMLVASKPSSNQLFPAYGLVKVGYARVCV